MGFFGSLFGGGASNFNPSIQQTGTQATDQMGMGKNLYGQSQGEHGLLSPFYQQEMQNPQGLGATTINQMLTQGGQSVAGGVGANRQRAEDIAARTGNTAAIPSIISSTGKAGMQQQSDLANKTAIANQMEKQKQQQEGAAGLSGLYKEDIGSSLGAYKGATEASKVELDAEKAQQEAQQAGMSSMLGGLTGGMSQLGKMIPGMGGQAAGGIGSLLGMFCWVAAKVFDEAADLQGEKTTLVRNWMQAHVPTWILNLYKRYGQWISTKPILVKALAPIFRWMLKKAEGK